MRCGALLIFLILLPGGAAAQEQQPVKSGVCVKDRSVEDYIVELRKMEKERKKGTHNPLPNSICLFGLCSHPHGGPGEEEKPTQRPLAAPPAEQREHPGSENESSSKQPGVSVPAALEAPPAYDPIDAAHNVDVGDYYYEQKNYRAALLRYEDARQSKPGDAAIHVRMGRALEQLDEPARAYLEYDSAGKLELEGKSASAAKEAMERLRKVLQAKGNDPETLTRNNEPEQAPCLHPAAR